MINQDRFIQIIGEDDAGYISAELEIINGPCRVVIENTDLFTSWIYSNVCRLRTVREFPNGIIMDPTKAIMFV